MTEEQFLEIASYLVDEPGFDDSPERCYKYPFVSCEALCIDNDHIANILF